MDALLPAPDFATLRARLASALPAADGVVADAARRTYCGAADPRRHSYAVGW